jgi:tetratricopeptide (TPR) repeat protein
MTNSRQKAKPLTSGLALAALAVAALLTGCRPSEEAAPNVPLASAGAPRESQVELTYPQSDPEGRYVALGQPGTYIIAGTVASQEPVRQVSVNGVEAVTYRLENYPAYKTPEDFGVYRFRAPVVWQPDTRAVVRVIDPPLAREYAYSPDPNATVSYWRQAAEATPADAGIEYRLGNALFAQNTNAAISTLSAATAVEADEAAPWSLWELGKAYLTAGRPAEALKPLNSAIAAYPTFADAYYDRGVTYYELQQYDQSAADLNRAAQLLPDWAEPLLALGQTYYAQKRLQDAAKVYERAGTIWPTWPAPEYSLAMVRLDEGRLEEATRHLDRAEKLGPWRAIHHQELAQKLFAKGNNVAAWRQVQIAHKLGGEPSQRFLVRLRRNTPEPPEEPMWWRTGKHKADKEASGLAKKKGKKLLKNGPPQSSNRPAAKQPPGQVRQGYPGQAGRKARGGGHATSEESPGQGGRKARGAGHAREESQGLGKHARRQRDEEDRGEPSAENRGESRSGKSQGRGR